MTARDDEAWWREAVIYQIYPRSFQDSDGDGIGDLRGIERRLDHLVELGVDALWLSPIYPSPMRDFGYDVADYVGVDRIFGSLEDFERLVSAAHGRGLKLLMDFVPSHSSDRHPWFKESRSSRDNPKRDWYVWRDPGPDGGPPNNWLGEFGGPAWTFDEATGQYYLNLYLPEQPATNWRNPEVRAAMYDALRFWFDRGVDGFRIDAIEHLAPDAELRDNPPNPDWTPELGPARSHLGRFTRHQPEIHNYVAEMRAVARAYRPERLLIGEAYGSLEEVMRYYGEDLGGVHLPFNFELIGAPWDARTVAAKVEAYEAALPEGAWPNWVLGNHDRARIATRAGPRQAHVAMTLLLTLRGTPTIYQGDELGMENSPIPPEAVQDPWEINVPGQGLGRDPVRTPIPWEAEPKAGFTTGEPWLPIAARPGLSVAEQAADPRSMLSYTRALLALRRREPALTRGAYRTLEVGDDLLVYERREGDRRLVVALNFSDRPQDLSVTGRSLLSAPAEPLSGALGPNEARILEV